MLIQGAVPPLCSPLTGSLFISELSGKALIIWGWASTMDNYPRKMISKWGKKTALSEKAHSHTTLTDVFWTNSLQNYLKNPNPFPLVFLYNSIFVLFWIKFPNKVAGWSEQIIKSWVDHSAETEESTYRTHSCTREKHGLFCVKLISVFYFVQKQFGGLLCITWVREYSPTSNSCWASHSSAQAVTLLQPLVILMNRKAPGLIRILLYC